VDGLIIRLSSVRPPVRYLLFIPFCYSKEDLR